MKFTVQIASRVLMSKVIEAESMEDALQIGKDMAKREVNGVKCERGWVYEYCAESEVAAVMK